VGFAKDCKPIIKKYPNFTSILETQTKRVVETHFMKFPVVASNKIVRITSDPNNQWSIWKLKQYVEGLRFGQWPRVWFAVTPSAFIWLAAAMHPDNNDDNEVERIARQRFQEIVNYEQNPPPSN
jgi:hypothetical protein